MKHIKLKYKSRERIPTIKLPKFALFLALLMFLIVGHAQNPALKVFTDWSTTSGTQNMFQRSVTRTITGTTDVVVAGATINSSGTFDILVQKISGSGSVIWSETYNGAGNGNDVATDVRVASNGEIYVCGTYYKDGTDSCNAIVIKYDANGNQRWTNTYNGGGSHNDGYSSLLVNGATVVAVGGCWGGASQYDMVTRRMDTAGATSWTTTYDNSGLADGAVSLTARSGSLFVTGGVQTTSTTYKIATWKINPSTGAITTTTLSSNSAIAIDRVNDVQEDANGNVYVAGTVYNGGTGFDYKLFKYDASLSLVWSATWDGSASLDDGITGLAIDSHNNVIVTGYTTTSGNIKDYATVKYNSSGTQKWVETYDGGLSASDSATAIVVGDTDHIIVTGYSYNGSTNDYYTIRYDASGTLKWETGFNSVHNANDIATGIALDTLNNVIVTGENTPSSGSRTYTTVKFIEKNTTLPQDTISGSSTSYFYTENRGQLLNTDTLPVPQIRYYSTEGSVNEFFSDTAVSFVLTKLDTSSSYHDTLCRVDMKCKSANPGTQIRSMDLRDDFDNFYLGSVTEEREHVRNYNTLVNFNVWNNIDVMYKSNGNAMKYYYECKTGSSPSGIDIIFTGADSIKVGGSGQLTVYTKLGNIVFPKAAAWELDGSGNFSSLGWQPTYNKVASNEIMFSSIGSYNSAHTLIIGVDPQSPPPPPPTSNQNLNWSTFYGGGGDAFYDLDISNAGDVVVGGSTVSSTFPTTTGSVMPTLPVGAMQVGCAVKFKQNHQRVWGTYYGGGHLANGSYGAITNVNGVAIDASGYAYLTGRTDAADLGTLNPGSAYTHATFLTSGSPFNDDVFIAELNLAGAAIWKTYYGSSGAEVANDIKVSPINGDVYIVGSCQSGFPTSSTPSWATGSGNGFIVRFDSQGALQMSTKVGGTGTGGPALGVAIDPSGNAVVCGAVPSSTGFPLSSPPNPTGNSSYGGGTLDAYILKIDNTSSNAMVWSTFFGGTGLDQANGVTCNSTGQCYIVGTTKSSSLPLQNPGFGAYYQGSLSGSQDAFLAEFNSNGTISWATYYGGTADERGDDVAVDGADNIYITGASYSSDLNTIPVFPNPNLTNGYYLLTLGGTYDAFLAGFQHANFAPSWGTYFDGAIRDEGFAIGCDGTSQVYIDGLVDTDPNFPFATGSGGAYFSNAVNATKGFVSAFDLQPFILANVEDHSANAFSVYPNPSSESIWITGTVNAKSNITIDVCNMLGQQVCSETIAPCSMLQKKVDVSSLADGVYFVSIKYDAKVSTQKIIIQR